MSVAIFPGLDFVVIILQTWNWQVHLVAESHVVYFIATLPVWNVVEAWVVSLLNSITLRQNSLANHIEVRQLCREPRDLLRAQCRDAFFGRKLSDFVKGLLHIWVMLLAQEVQMELNGRLSGEMLLWD